MSETTTTPAAFVAVPTTAVQAFLGVFNDGLLAHHVAERFTCMEAEALAELFRALGDDEAAELWLDAHAEGDDDEDDLHYQG